VVVGVAERWLGACWMGRPAWEAPACCAVPNTHTHPTLHTFHTHRPSRPTQDVLGLRLNRVVLAPDAGGMPPGGALLHSQSRKVSLFLLLFLQGAQSQSAHTIHTHTHTNPGGL
jgi:hypothetical protein